MGDDAGFMAEKFAEELPVGANACPPPDAITDALKSVWRLLPTDQPTEHHFASLAALGEDKPTEYEVSDCDFASCSLRTSRAALLKLRGLRRRNPYIAELSIPAGNGRHKSGGTHVNFWKFAGYQIVSAIVLLEPHGLT